MFVRHRVADYAKWCDIYDEFDKERQGMGVMSHGVYQLDVDPNDVTLYHQFASLDASKAVAGSPRLKEVMQSAGVQNQPDIWFTHKN